MHDDCWKLNELLLNLLFILASRIRSPLYHRGRSTHEPCLSSWKTIPMHYLRAWVLKFNTVNRQQRSSGLTAVNQIANQIRAGQIDISVGASKSPLTNSNPQFLNDHLLGAGVESMSNNGYGASAAPLVSDEVRENRDAEDCLLPMGITSNILQDFSTTSRRICFQKAAAANKAGKFKAEIIPITTKFIDPKTEKLSLTKMMVLEMALRLKAWLSSSQRSQRMGLCMPVCCRFCQYVSTFFLYTPFLILVGWTWTYFCS